MGFDPTDINAALSNPGVKYASVPTNASFDADRINAILQEPSGGRNRYAQTTAPRVLRHMDMADYTDFHPVWGQDNDLRRAQMQSGWEQLAHGFGNLIPNITLGLVRDVGVIASLFESGPSDYSNSFVEAYYEHKDPFPIYREKPNKIWDPADPAWWIQNIGQTAESVGTFALEGWGLGKLFSLAGTTLARGLATNTKLMEGIGKIGLDETVIGKMQSYEIGNAIGMRGKTMIDYGMQRVAHLANSYTLGYVEGGQIARDVYNNVYATQIASGKSDFEAKMLASKGANVAASINTVLIGSLNLAVLAPLIPVAGKTTMLKGALKPLAGEDAQLYISRLEGILSNPVKKLSVFKPESFKKLLLLESGQEFFEEAVVNNFAEYQGNWTGGVRKKYYKDPLLSDAPEEDYFKGLTDRIFSSQALLEGLLGALGGFGQAGILGSIKNQKIYDPTTGIYTGKKETSIQATNRSKQDFVFSIVNNLKTDVQYINSVKDELLKLKDDTSLDAQIKRSHLTNRLFMTSTLQSVMNGTGETLINTYLNLKEIDNSRDLGDVIDEKIKDIKSKIEEAEATMGADPTIVTNLNTELTSLEEDKKVVKGKTQAMYMGFAENPNDNEYKTKADEGIQLINKLSGLSDFIESNYNFDLDSQLSGFTKEIYKLHWEMEQYKLSKSHLEAFHKRFKQLVTDDLIRKGATKEEIYDYFEDLYLNEYYAYLKKQNTVNKLRKKRDPNTTRRIKYNQTQLDNLTARLELRAVALKRLNRKLRTNVKKEYVDYYLEEKQKDLDIAYSNTYKTFESKVIEFQHLHDEAADRLANLTKDIERKKWIENWKVEKAKVIEEARKFKHDLAEATITRDDSTIEDLKSITLDTDTQDLKTKLDNAILKKEAENIKKETHPIETKVETTDTIENPLVVDPISSVVVESTVTSEEISIPEKDTLLSPETVTPLAPLETKTDTKDESNKPIHTRKSRKAIVPTTVVSTTTLTASEQEVKDLGLPPQVQNMLDALSALELPKKPRNRKSKSTTHENKEALRGQEDQTPQVTNDNQTLEDNIDESDNLPLRESIDLSQELPITTGVEEHQLINAALAFGHIINLMSADFGEFAIFTMQDVVSFINTYDPSGKTTIVYRKKLLYAAQLLANNTYRSDEHSIYTEIYSRIDFSNIKTIRFNDLPNWYNLNEIIIDRNYKDNLAIYTSLVNKWDPSTYLPTFGFTDGTLAVKKSQNDILTNLIHNPDFGKEVIIKVDVDYANESKSYGYKNNKGNSNMIPIVIIDKVTGLRLGQIITLPYIMKNIVHTGSMDAKGNYWFDHEDVPYAIEQTYNIMYELYRNGYLQDSEQLKAFEKWDLLYDKWYNVYNINRGQLVSKGGRFNYALMTPNTEEDIKIQEALIHISKSMFFSSRLTNADMSSYETGRAAIFQHIDSWRDYTNSMILHARYIRNRILNTDFNSTVSEKHGGTIIQSTEVNGDRTVTFKRLDQAIAIAEDGKIVKNSSKRAVLIDLWFSPRRDKTLLLNSKDTSKVYIKKTGNPEFTGTTYVMIQGIPVPVYNARIYQLDDSTRYVKGIYEYIKVGLTNIKDADINSMQHTLSVIRSIIVDNGGKIYRFNSNEKDVRDNTTLPSFDIEYKTADSTNSDIIKGIKIQMVTDKAGKSVINIIEGEFKKEDRGINRFTYNYNNKIAEGTSKFDELLNKVFGAQLRNVIYSEEGISQNQHFDPIANEKGEFQKYNSYQEYVIKTGALLTTVGAYTYNGVPISNVMAKGFSNFRVNIDMVNMTPTQPDIAKLSFETVKPVSKSKVEIVIEQLKTLELSIAELSAISSDKELQLIQAINPNIKVYIRNSANEEELLKIVKDKLNDTDLKRYNLNKQQAWAIGNDIIILNEMKFSDGKPKNGLLLHENLHTRFNAMTKEERINFNDKTKVITNEITERILQQEIKEGRSKEVVLILNWLKEIKRSPQEAYTYLFETFKVDGEESKAIAIWLSKQLVTNNETKKEESFLRRLFNAFLEVIGVNNTLLDVILDTIEDYISPMTIDNIETLNTNLAPTQIPDINTLRDEAKKIGQNEDFNGLWDSTDLTINADELYEQAFLNDEIEIECGFIKSASGSMIKAKHGLTTSFTTGGNWLLAEDLMGMPKHTSGGIDVFIDNGNINFVKDGAMIHAKHGLIISSNGS